MKIRVYYEDTDTGGIVYHSNYINFCERARSEAFFCRDISPVLNEGSFVAKKLEANYIKPAKLGDMLDVKSELKHMAMTSFTLTQSIYKKKEKLFEMDIVLVYINNKGRPQKLGENRDLIKSLFLPHLKEDCTP